MTLSSQAPRAGASRQHMFRKRRRRRWPVVALIVCIAGVAAVLLWPRTDPAPSQAFSHDQQARAADDAIRALSPRGPLEPDPKPQPAPRPGTDAGFSPPEPPAPIVAQEPQVILPGRRDASDDTPAQAQSPPAAPQGQTPAHRRFVEGKNLIENQRLVEGRRILSGLLFANTTPITDALADDIRTELDRANATLVFSPTRVDNDPLALTYKVQPGDRLSRIAPRYGLTSRFVAQINGIDPNRIRVGQPLKLLQGPLHARVTKRRYVMDLYAYDRDGQAVYLKSYKVGLGTDDSTPIGSWVVEPGRKAINPDWRDDRTGEYYASDNPDNPIGEFWLALKGTDAATQARSGYGIHGTIDPDSIGTMASRGCIRLRDKDIEEVFHLLVEGGSTVHILP